ncbi:MAG: gamma-glutamyltransferase, partial [Firmicutes bacterium]|nr:gamma-glutamyltransferase [Bacillota bacterium]
CESNFSGIGGGGFMLIRSGKTGECVFLDFREKAPAAASPAMYEASEDTINVDIHERNIYGGASVAVPGEVDGLLYALENYGTMSPSQVISPAAELARKGFAVSPVLVTDLERREKHLKELKEGARVYFKDGRLPKTGDIMTNPDLADTLELIAEGGRDSFYKGPIADKIVEAVRKTGGILTHEDLENYHVRVLEPVRGSYRGCELISSPPPSSGGTHVIEILNVLENFDVPSLEVNSAGYIHLFSEVFKLCYSDRAAYMGDPNFVKVPLKGLLSKEYARTLAEKVDLSRSRKPCEGDPLPYESSSTTHFSIADSEGNMVAVTKTVNNYFGSCLMPEGTGFFLNDQMADFALDPASPNAVLGGKIPLSSMSPTFILKDGRPLAVTGSPGSTRIISAVVQIASKLIDHGMGMEEAVNSPRFGDDTSDCIIYETRIPEETADALRAMGHSMKPYGEWNRIMGSANSLKYLEDGTIEGAADPRREGLAVSV